MESAYWRAICESGQKNTPPCPLLTPVPPFRFHTPIRSQHTANTALKKPGTGSWARKKATINSALGREALFKDLMRKLKREFENLAANLGTDIGAAVEDYLGDVKGTLDIVRSENVALEGERNPEFRARVAEELGRVIGELERVRVRVGV
jgi:hypothetical protein